MFSIEEQMANRRREMPRRLLNLRHKLRCVIKRFKFEELETAVLPCFPEVSWCQVRASLVKEHESFTVANAARVIDEAIDAAKLNQRELRDRLSALEVIDISRHHTRKVWYGYELCGANKLPSFPSNRDIQLRVKDNFDVHQMQMDVRVVTHDGLTFMSITEKQSRRGVQHVTPVFFAVFWRLKYLFSSRKYVSKEFVSAVTEGMGYAKCRKIELTGRDLKSLVRMLQAKRQGAVHADNVQKPPELAVPKPVVKSTGTDFTQRKQRRAYMDKCFGEDPPALELFAINSIECPWPCEDLPLEVREETTPARWEFHSRNVALLLKRLVESRVIVTPLPPYVTNLMTQGKNELTLRPH